MVVDSVLLISQVGKYLRKNVILLFLFCFNWFCYLHDNLSDFANKMLTYITRASAKKKKHQNPEHIKKNFKNSDRPAVFMPGCGINNFHIMVRHSGFSI